MKSVEGKLLKNKGCKFDAGILSTDISAPDIWAADIWAPTVTRLVHRDCCIYIFEVRQSLETNCPLELSEDSIFKMTRKVCSIYLAALFQSQMRPFINYFVNVTD